MALYNIFFFGAIFFILGIFFASLSFKVSIIFIAFIFFAVFIFLKWRSRDLKFLELALLSLMIFLGAFYFNFYNQKFSNINIVFDKEMELEGKIINNPVKKEGIQSFKARLNDSELNFLVKTTAYPEFHYGDRLQITGKISDPFPEGYKNYLRKENVWGVMTYPDINLVKMGEGNYYLAKLYALRNSVIDSLKNILPARESGFLSGLLLGSREELGKDFEEAMKMSGTTHLVALSGYNIMIITTTLMSIFLYFASRKVAYIFISVFIVAFVLMTGAEASIVRAAIMGLLILIASQTNRLYDARNAIVFAGLVMVIHNPNILVFDIGFQLSFLALMGIVYLKPMIMGLFHLKRDNGIFNWKENLMTTLAAQIAVLPILLNSFGQFSPFSIMANLLILSFIPVTMGFGFVLVLAIPTLYYLSFPIAMIVSFLLKIEIGLINFFAKFGLILQFQAGWGFILIYYGLILGLMFYVKRSREFYY